jgi:hypothetical protein
VIKGRTALVDLSSLPQLKGGEPLNRSGSTLVMSGTPGLIRTGDPLQEKDVLTLVFTMPDRKKKRNTREKARHYSNPMVQALQWEKELAENTCMRRIDLARKYKVTSARVAQVMNLLRLPRYIIDEIVALGETFDTPVISWRKLIALLKLPAEQQRVVLKHYLSTLPVRHQ